MRVLVDTNIVLDLFLDRPPFAADAVEIFSLVECSRIEGFLCATSVTTIDYLLNLHRPEPAARRALQRLLSLFEIAPVNRSVIEQALRSGIKDFEDAVIEQSGLLVGVDAIVSRNLKDFKKSSLPVFDPPALLAVLGAREVADPAGD